jgi:rod shape-determining protein MreD
LTALLLQATVVGPAAGLVPISLPAVLVAVVALSEGPATGMSLGFTAGLFADLSSSHPAGVLALCWLAVGTVCGMARDDRRHWPARAAVAGTACALAAVVAVLLLRLLSVGTAPIAYCLPALIGDVVLAAALAPVASVFLRSQALQPVGNV